MGCCASKPNPSSILSSHQTQNPHSQNESKTQNNSKNLSAEIVKKQGKESEGKLGFKKKEIFVIQHRRSHGKRSEPKGSSSDSGESAQPASLPDTETGNPKTEAIASNIMAMAANGAAVRTSSCTKEEVDAILIQCGRLSRSSSGKGPISGSARKYSGSKRSHDFDREIDISTELNCDNDDERQTRRQSRGSHRRRTPSRSRERDSSVQRSGSRERIGGASGSGSRRVSRSPGRRSDSPVPNSGNLSNSANNSNNNSGIRPGKMVSVPATVSIEKNNNGDCNVKRVLVKRNVGGDRGNTPPRSRSPAARSNVGNEGSSSSQASLSRSSSRKTENSPFRRAPLNEVDMNSLPFQPLANRANTVKCQQKSNEIEEVNDNSQDKFGVDMSNAKDKREQLKTLVSAPETVKLPLTLTKSRSSRRSRDLDINVEALLNPSPTTNYNLLLLQDIKNFHQKTNVTSVNDTNQNSNTPIAKTPFSLPECLSKVSSIVEAVADLNSSTKPNISFTSADDKQRNFSKFPFMESEEVKCEDDNVSAPSMHKYVTVRKRGSDFESFQGGDFDELESSGSNSYTSGSRHHCVSSSSWEPNSADSTDRWTSMSRDGVSPVTLDRSAFSKAGSEIREVSERKVSGNRGREFSEHQQRGLTRSALGAGR